jgi:hypothetical protein
MSIPWQADFNECTYQNIDVTFELFNVIYPQDPPGPGASTPDAYLTEAETSWQTLWWPVHHPMQVYVREVDEEDVGKASYTQVDWARGVTQTTQGDLDMVTAWKRLGFVLSNDNGDGDDQPKYYEVDSLDKDNRTA